jgi:hypothetical protein
MKGTRGMSSTSATCPVVGLNWGDLELKLNPKICQFHLFQIDFRSYCQIEQLEYDKNGLKKALL